MTLTHEQKIQAYRAGNYQFKPPPVCCDRWLEDDWIRYIDTCDGWLVFDVLDNFELAA